MWLRLRQMLVKEFIQVFRDKRTRFLLFGPPIIQMVVFGYAAILDIQHVPMAVLDYENSQVSRDFVSRFEGSRYFDVRERTLDQEKLRRMIDHGDVTVAVQVNAGFIEQDDYVYYPDYQMYYGSRSHRWYDREGASWVAHPEPRDVSVDVLRSSPSVRMDFHDSPAHHHSEVVQKYPGNRAPSRSDQDQKDNRKGDGHDHGGENPSR